MKPNVKPKPKPAARAGRLQSLPALPGDHSGGSDVPLIALLAATKLGLHLATIAVTPYSVHRDELLYLAMGRYLRLFAMDFPPLIALLANATRFLFGDTLFAIRILPALAGTAVLVLSLLIVREIGGGRTALLLTGLAMLAAPLFLRSASLFQPVVFDQLWWTLALLALLRIGAADSGRETGSSGGGTSGSAGGGTSGSPDARHAGARNWLLLGAAGGLGLLTKFSIAFIALGVLAAILITQQRRWLRTRWPYLAAAVALVIGSPSIIGQIALGFPVAGQMGDLQATQLERVTTGAFLSGQVMMIGPAVLLALAGAVWLLAAGEARPWRAAGWAAVVAFGTLLLLHGKAYYAGPVYPLLLAAGAVALERTQRWRRTLIATTSLLTIAYGAVTLPLGLPVLPPASMARYAAGLGVTSAVRTNTGTVLPLPQDYADMLGWEEQVTAVAAAYHALPAVDRDRAVLIASNYGEAGAIDFFGARHGLPRAVAPIGSYWFFGPGALPGDVAVTIGFEAPELDGFYHEAVEVARVANAWGVPEQQDNPILVARRPLRTLQQVWPELAGRN
jgi:hypothetical protein